MRWGTLCFFALLWTGCGSKTTSLVAGRLADRTWTQGQESPPERAYCNTTTTHSPGYTISGQALFQYRPVSQTPGEQGLRELAATPKPIRHAQIEILDTTNNVIQCGETNAQGQFSLSVPRDNAIYILNVYSRSLNAFNKASVFKAPETNELYKLSHSFKADAHKSGVQLLASATDQALLGGAFNILDQVHRAFDRLPSLTSSLTSSQAVLISEFPKAEIYWERGFNPGYYVDVDSGISFFSPPQKKLFILGGMNGDVNYADTDHFDNSVILHEYFHFLEYLVSKTDTPGGKHSGNQILDPRLAWSEGAAQFFQAVIREEPTVLDTRGNVDGDTGFQLKFSVESVSSDTPEFPGEGEYREFSVARFLWDLYDHETDEQAPEVDFDNISGQFHMFWGAFANKSLQGLNSSSSRFRSLGGLLHSIGLNDTSIHTNADWQNLMEEETLFHPLSSYTGLDHFRNGYAIPLVSGASSTFQISYSPSIGVAPNIFYAHPTLHLKSFSVSLSAPGSLGLSNVSANNGSGGQLEAYIYAQDYENLAQEQGHISQGSSLAVGAGTYLIVVKIAQAPSVTDPSLPTSLNFSITGFGL